MSITVVIVSFKSDLRIEKCLKNIGRKYRKIIVENSKDKKLKVNLERKFSKTKVILTSNIGFGAAMNLGVRHVKTKYVFMTTPDVILNKNTLKNLLSSAKKLNNKFSFLAPATKYYKNKKIKKVDTWVGLAIFVEKRRFQKVGGFDKKFFLFYEDHDLCKRFNKTKEKIYMVPNARVNHAEGGFYDVKLINEIEVCKNWHYMWSKFYFNRKHRGLFCAYFITSPFLIRSLLKSFFYFFLNKRRFRIYFARFSGLFNAYINRKSWYRPLLKA